MSEELNEEPKEQVAIAIATPESEEAGQPMVREANVEDEKPTEPTPPRVDFSFKYPNAKNFRAILSAIAVCADQPKFIVTPEGISSSGLGLVAMFVLDIEPRANEQWNVPASTEVVMDTAGVIKLLKKVSDEPVTVSPDWEKQQLLLVVEGELTTKYRITIPGYTQAKNMAPPKLDFKAAFTMSPSRLVNILEHLAAVSEQLDLTAYQDEVTFKALGECDSVEIPVKRSEITEVSVTEAPVHALYSISYLKDMAVAFRNILPREGTVKIEFSSDRPVRLGIEHQGVHLQYYLPPRLES